MSRTGIWLFGLASAAALWLASIYFESPRFERDLAMRASAILREKFGDSAFANAHGRDIRLDGLIFDESARAGAVAAVAAIPGVRLVADSLASPPPLSPYSWRAVWDGATLTLSGAAPSPVDRASLVAAAKQALPEARIVDEMTYASGAPPEFAAQAARMLPPLARLQSGEAQQSGSESRLAGEAATPADYQAALAAAAGLPLKIEIAAPRAANFAFEAENDGKTLRLAGFVGSETDRAVLLAEARRVFPEAKIADAMQVASGAPPRFAAEAAYAIRALAQLKKGKVALNDHKARISGFARPGMDAGAIAAALPPAPGVILEAKDVAASSVPPDISPYVMSAEKSGQGLSLSGYCGDDDSCAKIRAEVHAKFAGLALADSLRRGSGAPKGFTTAALEGLSQLARLRVGRLSLRDASANLGGDAVRATTADDVKTALVAAMPEDFSVQADVTGAERQLAGPPPAESKEEAAPPIPAPPMAAPVEPAEPPPPISPPPAKEAALPAAGPAKSEEKCKARLGDKARAATIQFDYGSAEIMTEFASLLDDLAAAAKDCPGAAFEISGHADDVGRVSKNLALSWRRAESVAAFLLAAGVEPQRLKIEGLGETKPSAPNDSDENRAKNRRIEIQVR